MSHLNIEIKARTRNPGFVREYLQRENADFRGVDHQTDTYFNVKNGRLKLREGNIENNLIYYHRPDQAGPKQSEFSLVPVNDPAGTREVFTQSLGVKIVVKKTREIYYIGNVKFHIDQVPGLGSFIEIEAGNKGADLPIEKLQEQCDSYMKAFQLKEEDLIDRSYSDMMLDT